MAMLPESMERWGVVGICKEAALLLRKHIRLFLPFYLAFLLPGSLLSSFSNVFLVAVPHPYTSFIKAAYTTAQGGEVDADGQPSLILLQTLSLLAVILFSLAGAAFAYIVEYVYSDADTASDDDSITKKICKLLPHALFRNLVTYLWMFLALLLLSFACVLYAFILNAIVTAIRGGPSGPTPAFFLYMAVPYVISTLMVSTIFALAQLISVLEPKKYGRAALKQSTKYARGREATIFCILILSMAIGLSIGYYPTRTISTGVTLWKKIIQTIIISIFSSVVSAYFGTVQVVMYFVCKSNSEAVLPEFQHRSNVPAAENPYSQPLLHENAKP
ncbi:hypothetical protein KC19_4G145100 [Ceratodon purpureus]|uniref:Uncharacterized protein n=1 Tax=Ceratodon purpureus TaxID=3225 RepID=A0A8T0IAW9_CERPU|nr:hypothetical protein KC19_4G145100 [Ceratodon purpureus]KAG0580076.1 hypothetical protein KC19_4G145100 [Ceratodon purpureus]KAG0580077.1 hypothetical protein KC19_4G145100 [Ceratodon purpureus]